MCFTFLERTRRMQAVILSAAKDLIRRMERSFAALRMTACIEESGVERGNIRYIPDARSCRVE
jgi:hypothetical protein